MHIRDFVYEQDKEAAYRIWQEVGWMEGGNPKEQDGMAVFASAGRAMVADLDGSPECLVFSHPGKLCYQDEELPFVGITGVTTSHVARKQGLAGRVTSQVIARAAEEGALVSGLGMFDQGFYNRLGFGSGGYEASYTLDPAQLTVEATDRVPKRVTPEDWQQAHALRLTRRRAHGLVDLLPPEITRAEMIWTRKGFGLGFCDGREGQLSHYVWCKNEGGEHGPYSVLWWAFQTREQFLELVGLLKCLGDQVHAMRLPEPPGIQLQDLVRQPFKQRRISQKSDFAAGLRCVAWWQMRMNDLPGCLARTHLCAETLSFNLTVDDPIARYLDDHAGWQGISGEYTVTLGSESAAERGHTSGLPELHCSENALVRLWLGVRSASGLAFTDDLRASDELLAALDRTLLLPQPHMDWDF